MQLQSELETKFPDYFALIKPAAIELAQAQAVLAPDEAMLLAVPSPRGTHTMLVTAREARWTTSQWNAKEIDRVTVPNYLTTDSMDLIEVHHQSGQLFITPRVPLSAPMLC